MAGQADVMAGSVAIVTGGGTGIGAAVVRALARRDVRCVVNYATSREAAEALANDVSGRAVQGDVEHDGACRAVVAATLDAFGRLDFVVNNAGRTKFAAHADLDALDAEDFLSLYRINAVGPFQMIRAAAPELRKSPHGAVVNVASVAGIHGHGSSVAYAASKGALVTMTQSLARALAPDIRINAVAPGYVGTGWFSNRLGEDGFAAFNQQVASSVPMALAATADDIAGPVVNLLDPASRAIAGEVLRIDAGAHLDVGLSQRPGRSA